jgi:hypothetical protein
MVRNVMLARCQSCTRELLTCYSHKYLLMAYSLFKDEDEDEEKDTKAASGTGNAIAALDPNVPRSAACEEWRIPVSELEIMVTKQESTYSEDQRGIRDSWNARVGIRYPRLTVIDMYKWLRNNPTVVARNFVELVVSDPEGWGHLRDGLNLLYDTFCTRLDSPEPVQHASPLKGTSTSANTSARLQRRFVNPNIGGVRLSSLIYDKQGRIPALSTIFSGIREGEVYVCSSKFY